MKFSFTSILKYFLFLGVGVILFWLAIKDQDINSIYNELLKTNYWWVGLSLVAMFGSHIFRSLRWKMLIESSGYKVRISTTTYSVFVGYFANLAVPRIGEITRCSVLGATDKTPVNALIGTVVVERVFDLICMVAIFIIMIFSQLDKMGQFVNHSIITPLFSSINPTVLIILAVSIVFIGFVFLWFFFKIILPRTRGSKFHYKFLKLYAGFISGIKSIRTIKSIPIFALYTFLIWFLYAATIFCVFFSMKETESLNFIDAVTIMIIGALGVVAPTPGGIGAYQFIVSKGLSEIFLINSLTAVTFSNVSYFSQWLLLIFAGLFSLLFITFIKRKSKF